MSAYNWIVRESVGQRNGHAPSHVESSHGRRAPANDDSHEERRYDPESGLFVSGGGDAKPDETWPAPTSRIQVIGGSLQTAPEPWDSGWVTMEELQQADVSTDFLLHRLIPAAEPMVIGGAAKTLKTTSVLDALMCISSGENFGDAIDDSHKTFSVPIPSRCAFVSAESGFPVLKKTSTAIAASRGREIREYSDLFLRAEKYDLTSPATHVAIARLVVRHRIKVLAFDPAFLMLAGIGDDAGNIFKMGKVLEPLTRISRDYGVTVMILHHFGKSVVLNGVGKKPELSWLSHAGFDAWPRAWWLISRREPFDPAKPGIHRFHLTAGGSAGHSEDLAVDVDEGFPFTGRDTPPQYSLVIRQAADVATQMNEDREEEKLDKFQARREKIAVRNAAKLLAMLEKSEGPVTMTAARSGTGVKLDSDDVRTAMARLVASGEVVETTIIATNKKQVQAWEINRNA